MYTKLLALIFMSIISEGGQSARGNIFCEVEALKSGGRSFLKLVRSGLETGDLRDSGIEKLCQSEISRNPVDDEAKITNQALRKGFVRALKSLKPNEWHAVRAELRNILHERDKQKKSVDEAKHATKSVINITPVGYRLEPKEELNRILVSSHSEIYFLTKLGKITTLRELNSKLKVPLANVVLQGSSAREVPSHGVVFALLLKNGDIQIFRARDQAKVFELNLKSLEPGFMAGIPPCDIALFDVNGRLKIAILNSPSETMGKAKVRRGLVIDFETREHEAFDLPNVLFEKVVGPDGALYVAGVGVEKEQNENVAFIKNVSTGAMSFFHRYPKDHLHDFRRLLPKILFDGRGLPRMHFLNSADNFDLYRAYGDTDMIELVEGQSPGRMTSYTDRNGRIQYASIIAAEPQPHLAFGDLESPTTAKLPEDSPDDYRVIAVAESFFGKLVFLWLMDDHQMKGLSFSNFSEGWTHLPLPLAQFKGASPPFFDKKSKTTFFFLKDFNEQWHLHKLYGNYGE